MADLSTDFCGIQSPNPFWLASAPPTNTGDQVMRAFDAGWGGAVWKTLGNPIVNVSSRFGGIDYGNTRLAGLNNIELITDRPLEVNLREIREVKRRYPKHAVIASLMVETKEEWREIILKAEDAGADGLELNFGCPHGMCERGMGSAVGNEPKVLEEIARWAVETAKTPVIVKLTPNIGDITEPGEAVVRSGAHAISLINTVKSIMGVDLERMVPLPRVGNASTNGGYCGPAVKPIALHLLSQLARHPHIRRLPISGIGGIAGWRDAAEFIALGSTTVQVCTAVMHYGYRIVEDMIEGLSRLPRRPRDEVRHRAHRQGRAAVPGVGRPRPLLPRRRRVSTSAPASAASSATSPAWMARTSASTSPAAPRRSLAPPGTPTSRRTCPSASPAPEPQARASPSSTRTSASAATSARWCARSPAASP